MRKTSGISLMLLIFLSLCLITFSLLSLSGANADEKLSARAADRTSEYYAAVNEANQTLALIDAQLAGYLHEAALSEEPEALWQELCPGLFDALPEISWTEDYSEDVSAGPAPQNTVSFSVPMNDSQILLVTLAISYPQEAEDTLYRISAWKTINTRDWTADTSQNLLQITEY